MNKKQLIYQVRNQFDLPQHENTWFTKEEMVSIVERLKGNDYQWTHNNSFFEEELYSMGWQPQETTDSHPCKINLQFLLDKLNTDPVEQDIQNHAFETFFTNIGFDLSNLKQITIERSTNQVVLSFD